MSKNSLVKILIPVVFFFIGLLMAFVNQKIKKQNQQVFPKTSSVTEADEGEDQGVSQKWKEVEVSSDLSESSSSIVNSQTKLTIIESKKLTADKTKAETGETVTFSTAIKNSGTKKKHLTHVCFNHSGGVTFGCLNGPQGPNLDPGKEVDISNTMMFTVPGVYYVWLTWSQDETNFYRPINSSSVKVLVE